jgi:hypothetical protein
VLELAGGKETQMRMAGTVLVDGKPAACLKSPGMAHITNSSIELGVAGKDGFFEALKGWNAGPVKP